MKFRRVRKTDLGLLVVVASMIFLAACGKPLQVTVSPDNIALGVGETGTVTATVTRKNNPQANVRVDFKTEDESVATVSPSYVNTDAAGKAQATVTGRSEGTTKVTARAKGKSDSANVAVERDGPRSPTVASVDPVNGNQDQTLDVTINGEDFQDGASSNFGAGITVNSTNFGSSTQLTANIAIAATAALGPRTVTVTNPDGLSGSLADAFTVGDVPPLAPTVTSVDPNTGTRGETLDVTINGTNFQNGASSNFEAGITVNSTNFDSSTQLTANIAIAATADLGSRSVTVTNPDGLSGSLADAFTVGDVPPLAPTVTSVDPVNGNQDQTLDVTINGTDFQNGASSSFGAGITVTSTNFVSSTELMANITIAAAAALGSRTVTVTNPDGQSDSLTNAFEVVRDIEIAGIGMVQDWEAKINGNLVTPVNNRVTIVIKPGDKITWRVRNSGGIRHGVVYESQAQMNLFLNIVTSQTLANRAVFFGGNGHGTVAFPSTTVLVEATVKDVADRNQELDFTCFQHGQRNVPIPAGLMNGTLKF